MLCEPRAVACSTRCSARCISSHSRSRSQCSDSCSRTGSLGKRQTSVRSSTPARSRPSIARPLSAPRSKARKLIHEDGARAYDGTGPPAQRRSGPCRLFRITEQRTPLSGDRLGIGAAKLAAGRNRLRFTLCNAAGRPGGIAGRASRLYVGPRGPERGSPGHGAMKRKDRRGMVQKSRVQEAIDAGQGVLRLEPSLGARARSCMPGRRLRLHPDDLYACGAHRGGINERWFSSTTNADNGPGTPADEGLSYVRLADGQRFLLKDAVEAAGDLLLGADDDGAREGLEPALQVLRQPGADPASHAPERRARQAGRPPRQARGVLLSSAVQPDRQQLSLHVHGPRAGDDEGRRPPVSRELEQGRQRHHLSVARVSPRARHRLADRSRHPARARDRS